MSKSKTMPDASLPAPVLQLIEAALVEDVGSGDVTSLYFVPESTQACARIVAREPGIVAGVEVAAAVFKAVDNSLNVTIERPDGTAFVKGDSLMRIEGSARSLLTAERTALNFLQRLCAIASQTRKYVEAVQPNPVKILDTRKTTPGWRWLEKHAVKCGGGTNHRIGLYDMVMVKDNHLLADDKLDDLQAAIYRVKTDKPGIRVELEADTLEQVASFLSLRGVDVILLDNMPCEVLRKAVGMVQGRVMLEASGGITMDTIRDVAATGVNAISIGALTHTVRALDLSLEF
jgi:nicotinate-nucleotide pyrophosphorylase (carboxylating)